MQALQASTLDVETWYTAVVQNVGDTKFINFCKTPYSFREILDFTTVRGFCDNTGQFD